MFIADRLIYLELQKTGGTHIRRLLKQYISGKTEGKHNRLLVVPEDKAVIGSIRNPWDWYVSLWAYGVSGKGAIRARTGTGLDFNYYYRMLPKAMGKNWLTPAELVLSMAHDIVKPVCQWQQSYQNSTDPALFKQWLKLLFDKRRRFDIGEGYGFSPLSQHAGLLTYRYFRLFTPGDAVFYNKNLVDTDALGEYDRKNNIAKGMIRMESLETDFIGLLDEAGVELSEQQKTEILNKVGGKTNASKRKLASFYYDAESLALVAQGDRYLIEKYGYLPPA